MISWLKESAIITAVYMTIILVCLLCIWFVLSMIYAIGTLVYSFIGLFR